MPKTISTATKTLTKLRSIADFTVTIPDDGADPFVTVVFAELEKDDAGAVLSKRLLPPMVIKKPRLLQLLPSNGLPDFATMYAGLSTLFHTEKDLIDNPPPEPPI